MTTQSMSPRAWSAFVAVSVLWGLPYLLIKVVVDDGVSPAFLAWARVLVGGLVLVGIVSRTGVLSAIRGRGRWLTAFTVFEIALPFPLIGFGEQRVSSSLAAIVIAAAPLFVAVLALRFDASERIGGLRLVGLVVGFAGVVALLGVDVAGSRTELLGAGAILAAALCYAIGPMILKRQLAALEPTTTMAASLTIGSLVLAPGALASPPTSMPHPTALLALLGLAVLCTALGLVLYGVLVAEAGPGRALVITYVNPVVAVALGVALLEERPGTGAIAGLLLILAGSWFSTGGGMPGKRGIRMSPQPQERKDRSVVSAA